MTREYDIVLFGATGFAGELTADYLAQHAPAQRSARDRRAQPEKLEALKARLGRPELGVLVADVEDAASIRALARGRTRGDLNGRALHPLRRAARCRMRRRGH